MSGDSSASRARSRASKAGLRPGVASPGCRANDGHDSVPGASESAGPTAPMPVAVTSNDTFSDNVLALKGMSAYSASPLTQSDGVVTGDTTAPTAMVVAGRPPHSSFDDGPGESSQALATRAATSIAAARLDPAGRIIGCGSAKRPAPLAFPCEKLICILRARD